MSYYARNHLQDNWVPEPEDDYDPESAKRTVEIHRQFSARSTAAKADFDTACQVAVDLHGHGSREHAVAINVAEKAYAERMAAARLEMAEAFKQKALDEYDADLEAVSEAMTEDRHVWDDTNQRWLEGKVA